MLADYKYNMRRGWDSNPRYPYGYTRFPGVPVKPLLHLSGNTKIEKYSSNLKFLSNFHEKV